MPRHLSPPPTPTNTPAKAWGWAAFAVCVAAFAIGGEVWGYRVSGVMLLGQAAHACAARSVPFGIRGRSPSGHLTGWVAIGFALVAAAIGLLMLVFPAEVAEALGKSHKSPRP